MFRFFSLNTYKAERRTLNVCVTYIARFQRCCRTVPSKFGVGLTLSKFLALIDEKSIEMTYISAYRRKTTIENLDPA